ncbi:MAG TPA: response regulator [Gemmatimonadales bacterium]|jgi:two-component system chemotaxis response regulator CheY|nr:response regulator [Gemmatimonadales bacterium]
MRCLILEDSLTAKRMLGRALAAVGCTELLEAANGKQALELCDGSVVLAILNWNLPGSGPELVRALRAKPGCAGLRIIVTSSHSSRAEVTRAQEAGVSHYLVRPFAVEALRARILDLLPELADGSTV